MISTRTSRSPGFFFTPVCALTSLLFTSCETPVLGVGQPVEPQPAQTGILVPREVPNPGEAL